MRANFIILCLAIFLACSENSTQINSLETNLNCDTIVLTQAKGFSIKQCNNGFILNVLNPFKGNDISYSYILSRDGNINAHNKFKIPVKKVICLSATHIGFIDALKKVANIKGISGKQYIYNPEVLLLINNGEIEDIGTEGNFDYEKIVSLNPDVVFAFGVDQKSLTYISKLQNLGIKVVLIGEYMENAPLGKAEWIKFFSCFFDCIDEASYFYEKISNEYLFLKDSINKLSINKKPMVINGVPYSGNWYIPGGNSFMANFMKDAGVDYSWVKNNETSGVQYSLEEIYEHASNFDFWLNPDFASSLKNLIVIEPRAYNFKAFKNKNIYNNTKRITIDGGNDYWETGTVHPEKILNDLFHIFHNNDTNKLYYYKKLD